LVWLKKSLKAWDLNVYLDAIQTLLMIVLEVGIFYIAIKLWVKDIIGIGGFFIIQAYVLEMFHNLFMFGRALRDIYEKIANAEEMTLILQKPHEVKDKSNAKAIKVTSGSVEFKNVNFSYKAKEESVIENFNLKIKPGEKVALIGPSGGGKSTFVKLLLRLYDIQEGEIIIDGQNIADITQDSLRREVTLVPQEPILFHRTLKENIKYGNRSASNKEIIAASKMAHCHEFIEALSEKYNTLVGERGIKLSGGQRQRVAIARAILSNAKILILDEATSSLDSESEVLIQKALQNLIKNKTTFIIAHRLSTIMSADRIIVLDQGKIIEQGTHADLINKKGSLYNKLWHLQIVGYM
ncbi:ATP-binding cassette domain-containing protein, partial [Candidatus Peregrinibacteria bacterium]|nr:ATP-binding cassette domain-containing protein [Candidatus Peregrinibacteria bacterium]